MENADGSILIITEIDSKGATKGIKTVKDELGDLGKSSESAGKEIGGSLSDGFKKLGAVLASSAIVGKLVDFGKQAVALGSDLEEVQNVVDVTFTTMSDSVNQFAKDAKKSAGLSETMAKRYVGTFGAMADSFGFAEAEAYEMSTTLTQLSGDVASFYNITQDEAMTKLKGVFTGETEALKELGVVMTQSALDAYALANGFNKTTSAMTEQEKVALRYQFVMDQLSAASGDFVRTSESWANQTRVLKLQWESLSATIGQGLIGALTPAAQFISDTVMPALQEVAEGFAELFKPKDSDKLESSLRALGKATEDVAKNFEDSSEAIKLNEEIAKKCVSRMDELEKAGLKTAEAHAEYANNVRYLNELYPDLNLQIDENTGLVRESTGVILANIDALSQKAMMAAIEERYTETLRAQANISLSLQEAEYARSKTEEQLAVTENRLAEATGATADELARLVSGYGGVRGAVVALTPEQQELLQQYIMLRDENAALTEDIEKGKKAYSDLSDELSSMVESMGLVIDEQGNLMKSTEAAAESVGALSTEYEAAKESARDSIEVQIGLFDKLSSESSMSASEIVANWKAQRDAINNYNDNLKKAVDMGLAPELVQQLADGSRDSMMYLEALVNSSEVSIEEINAAFEERLKADEAVSATMEEVVSSFNGKMAEIKSSAESNLSDITETFRSEINLMQKAIDGLSGKTVYIDIAGNYGSSSGGKPNLPTLPTSVQSASYNVPYLASGAVIPPNAPFAAVLGDQRNGNNLEAPEDLIRKIVREESGGVGTERLESLLESLLIAVESIEVGDTVIGEAASRYASKQKMIHGGGVM